MPGRGTSRSPGVPTRAPTPISETQLRDAQVEAQRSLSPSPPPPCPRPAAAIGRFLPLPGSTHAARGGALSARAETLQIAWRKREREQRALIDEWERKRRERRRREGTQNSGRALALSNMARRQMSRDVSLPQALPAAAPTSAPTAPSPGVPPPSMLPIRLDDGAEAATLDAHFSPRFTKMVAADGEVLHHDSCLFTPDCKAAILIAEPPPQAPPADATGGDAAPAAVSSTVLMVSLLDGSVVDSIRLEGEQLVRRRRLAAPSPAAWSMAGDTLVLLAQMRQELQVHRCTPTGFVHACTHGAHIRADDTWVVDQAQNAELAARCGSVWILLWSSTHATAVGRLASLLCSASCKQSTIKTLNDLQASCALATDCADLQAGSAASARGIGVSQHAHGQDASTLADLWQR